MKLKWISALMVLGLGFLSGSALALDTRSIDMLFGGGYSNYSYYQDGDTISEGYNASLSALYVFKPFRQGVSVVMGPSVKYENTSSSDSVAYGVTQTQTMRSLFVGPELGLKFSPSVRFSFWTTGFFNYAAFNDYTIKYTSSWYNLSDNPAITNAWQAGLNLRAVYQMGSRLGVGVGLQAGRGHYTYDAYQIGWIAFYSGGESFYNELNGQFILSYSL